MANQGYDRGSFGTERYGATAFTPAGPGGLGAVPATIRLEALDGVWEVGGADRARGVWPEGLNCVWDKWGPKTARWVFRRDPGAPWPDLTAFTPVEIEKNGIVGWEGFIDDTPEEDDHAIAVQAIGWPDHGDHDPFQKTYVHTRLGDWRDARSLLSTDLATWKVSGHVEAGTGGLVIGWGKETPADANQHVGVTLDLGPDNTAERVVVDVETVNGVAAYTFVVRGHDTENPNPPAGQYEDAIVVGMESLGTGFQAGTLTTPRRYITILLYRDDGASSETTEDRLVRVKAARVFADTAYESGNQSILTVTDVLKDALPFCPKWSQDTTGIEAVALKLLELAMTADRPFRELADSLNALHNYVLKLAQGRRLVFKPQPSVPMFVAGPWAGINFKDASKNSARDIYNKATGTGVGPAGEQVKVERWAGQQPGVAGELLSSPSFPNPSFDTDTVGWTVDAALALVRDAAVFDTAPASGAVNNIHGAQDRAIYTEGASGTFLKGVPYRITVRWRSGSGTQDVQLRLGVPGEDQAVAEWLAVAAGAFTSLTVVWIPKENAVASSVRFEMWPGNPTGSTAANFDTLTLESVRPTLIDRRGFARSKSLSISQAIDTNTLQTMADVWLQGHRRTPLRGDLEVVGRALRRYQGGAGVDPFEIGVHVGELVHLGSEIDPDTGDVGRDAPIVQITYSGDDESAQVSLDQTRENFESAVARFDLLAGAGR